jgi:hypothetical protein
MNEWDWMNETEWMRLNEWDWMNETEWIRMNELLFYYYRISEI